MTPQTRLQIREARKIYKSTKLSTANGQLLPTIGYNRVAFILNQVTDDCPLARYRIEQLLNKIKN